MWTIGVPQWLTSGFGLYFGPKSLRAAILVAAALVWLKISKVRMAAAFVEAVVSHDSTD